MSFPTKGGHNPPNTSTARPKPPQGSGGGVGDHSEGEGGKMTITFSKKPTHYDINGTPVYLSDCGAYRLVHRRHGAVLTNGKAETDYWDLHMLRGKNDWLVVRTRYKTKSEAAQEATIHAALLAVQLQMEKNNEAGHPRSRRTHAPRNRRPGTGRSKRNPD